MKRSSRVADVDIYGWDYWYCPWSIDAFRIWMWLNWEVEHLSFLIIQRFFWRKLSPDLPIIVLTPGILDSQTTKKIVERQFDGPQVHQFVILLSLTCISSSDKNGTGTFPPCFILQWREHKVKRLSLWRRNQTPIPFHLSDSFLFMTHSYLFSQIYSARSVPVDFSRTRLRREGAIP